MVQHPVFDYHRQQHAPAPGPFARRPLLRRPARRHQQRHVWRSGAVFLPAEFQHPDHRRLLERLRRRTAAGRHRHRQPGRRHFRAGRLSPGRVEVRHVAATDLRRRQHHVYLEYRDPDLPDGELPAPGKEACPGTGAQGGMGAADQPVAEDARPGAIRDEPADPGDTVAVFEQPREQHRAIAALLAAGAADRPAAVLQQHRQEHRATAVPDQPAEEDGTTAVRQHHPEENRPVAVQHQPAEKAGAAAAPNIQQLRFNLGQLVECIDLHRGFCRLRPDTMPDQRLVCLRDAGRPDLHADAKRLAGLLRLDRRFQRGRLPDRGILRCRKHQRDLHGQSQYRLLHHRHVCAGTVLYLERERFDLDAGRCRRQCDHRMPDGPAAQRLAGSKLRHLHRRCRRRLPDHRQLRLCDAGRTQLRQQRQRQHLYRRRCRRQRDGRVLDDGIYAVDRQQHLHRERQLPVPGAFRNPGGEPADLHAIAHRLGGVLRLDRRRQRRFLPEHRDDRRGMGPLRRQLHGIRRPAVPHRTDHAMGV